LEERGDDILGDDNNRMQYQSLLDALKSTKNQQWLLSTYVLALQIGIVKLFIDTENLISDNQKNQYIWILIIASWVISILGSFLVIGYLHKIFEYRKEKNKVAVKLELDIGGKVDCFEIFVIIIFVLFYFGLAFCINSFLITQFVIVEKEISMTINIYFYILGMVLDIIGAWLLAMSIVTKPLKTMKREAGMSFFDIDYVFDNIHQKFKGRTGFAFLAGGFILQAVANIFVSGKYFPHFKHLLYMR